MSRESDDLLKLLSEKEKTTEKSEEDQTKLPDLTSKDLVIKYQSAQLDRLKEEIEGIKQDREQRKIFGYVIFGFMCLYMLAVLMLVYLCGFGVFTLHCLTVSSSRSSPHLWLMSLGIFNFVAKYLFHTK